MLLSLPAIILTLILVVGIHEAGHAIAARIFSVKIKRISIGFGKLLITWKGKSDQEWVWAIWPLGGYVQLLNSRIQPVSPQELPLCFDQKPVWIRCIILLSGALANLLVAWLALTWLFLIGYQHSPPVILDVAPHSVAAQAGLESGNRLISMGQKKTDSWREAGMLLIMALGKKNVPVAFKDNQGNVRETSLDLSQWRYNRQDDSLLSGLGIIPDSAKEHQEEVKSKSVVNAAYRAVANSMHLLVFFLVMLKQLLTGMIPFSLLLGPIGLFAASTGSFLQGFTVFLYFIASLSLAVGLINLFPVPGLDGGSIVYALLEKIRGKPVSVAMEVLLHRLAVIFFAVLLVQLLLNDLQRYLH
ncbi:MULTISPECIES: RIP metalloprotease [unclassified Legionella]|uniref:M50 family metallopeptidase n=1 Tax=unclassified Legionella TaxID=2622702 RepID=UPI0010569009|nr:MULTISPECIES: site-2 protease family protein [unclassified Legionella]MDI9819091.1 site-2 protease family protein [Legionella sp. PL877]